MPERITVRLRPATDSARVGVGLNGNFDTGRAKEGLT